MAVTELELGDFVSLPTAARRLGYDRSHLNALVLEGRLPAQRFGQHWLLRRADIEAFAAAHDREPQKEIPIRSRPAAMAMVALLAGHDGSTTPELVDLTGSARRTVLGRLQTLDQYGLIRREPGRAANEPDRCWLTDAGWRFYREDTSRTIT